MDYLTHIDAMRPDEASTKAPKEGLVLVTFPVLPDATGPTSAATTIIIKFYGN